MEQLTIAAVARLTGVPAHTLRKWESRHDIGTPQRTPTGRRVYDMSHVELLRLVRLLSDSGHSLTHLAALDLDGLKALAGKHNLQDAQHAMVDSVLLVGHKLAHLALPAARFEEIGRQACSGDEWLIHPVHTQHQALVIELATINPEDVERLLELRSRYEKIVVVYSFANRTSLRHLELSGTSVSPAPISAETLMHALQSTPVDAQTLEQPTPRARFSDATLAKVAAMTPGLQCECPNHIASLLMSIGAFEQYCRECEDTDPKEKVLHQHLAELSGAARGIFEQALIEVAKADNLDLAAIDAAASAEDLSEA
ncbi:MAG: MerR family transcriptional regulator [bacterium]